MTKCQSLYQRGCNILEIFFLSLEYCDDGNTRIYSIKTFIEERKKSLAPTHLISHRANGPGLCLSGWLAQPFLAAIYASLCMDRWMEKERESHRESQRENQRENQRERESQRERKSQRERERESQREKKSERKKESERERQRDRERQRERNPRPPEEMPNCRKQTCRKDQGSSLQAQDVGGAICSEAESKTYLHVRIREEDKRY